MEGQASKTWTPAIPYALVLANTLFYFLAFYFSGPPYPACTLSLEWKPPFLDFHTPSVPPQLRAVKQAACFVYFVARQDWVGTGNRTTGEDLGLAGQVVLKLAVW